MTMDIKKLDDLLELTAARAVNIRVGEPRIKGKSNLKGTLNEGFTIIIQNLTHDGESVSGNSTWLQDLNGDWYWSGGFRDVSKLISQATDNTDSGSDNGDDDNDDEEEEEEEGAQPGQDTPPTAERAVLEQEIERYTEIYTGYPGDGAGIGVAVLDSGVDENHTQLSDRVEDHISFLKNDSFDGVHPHGTKVAGVIASDQPGLNRNKSSLYCMLVTLKSAPSKPPPVDDNAVKKALSYILETKELHEYVHIVNMSLNIMKRYVSIIQPLVNSLLDLGIVTVVAAGQDDSPNHIAMVENTIKVGTFSSSYFEDNKPDQIPDFYDCVFVDLPIPSYSIGGKDIDTTINQDSAYCAYFSGLLARVWSLNMPEEKQRYGEALKFIKNHATSLNGTKKMLPLKLYI